MQQLENREGFLRELRIILEDLALRSYEDDAATADAAQAIIQLLGDHEVMV